MSIENQVARDILEYFSQHPDAEDSLEGVAAWRQESNVSTQGLIDELVRQRLLLTTKTSDGEALYRLNPGKKEQIRRLLNRP